jgi:hypothetical protein
MALTLDEIKKMSPEDMHNIYWDWFKDVHGIRPRHVRMSDTDTMISFFESEMNITNKEENKIEPQPKPTTEEINIPKFNPPTLKRI